MPDGVADNVDFFISPRTPWYFRRPFVLAALVLFYPLGLMLLIRSPRESSGGRWAMAVLSLPIAAVAALLSLNRFWDFDGGMKLQGFRLDFFKGWFQDRRVENHRKAQGRLNAGTFTPSPAFADLSWPAFRGPDRDGRVTDAPISTNWKANPPKQLWRQPVGEGYAAFVIGSGRLYTIEQRREKEAVVCYDASTGKEIWLVDYAASFEETLGGDGPRATPTLHGERLYAFGAEGDLNCLSALTGERYWGRNILREFGAENLPWGMSASPLVVDEKVIVTNSGKGAASLLAYNVANGELVWKTGAGQQGYSSPMLVTLAGRRQLLNLAARTLNGVDPTGGAILWSFPWETQYGINVSQSIVVGDDHVFVSSGYGHGCALLQITGTNEKLTARQIWSNTRMKNKFTSSVLRDDFVYGLDEQALACLDVETGQRKWKGGRYGYGSILLVGDHILVLSEDGLLALVEAKPDAFTEVGRLQILEGRTWNNPAVAGGYLFARNHKEMVCYDLRPRAN